ncbi:MULTISPECIES: MoxR family ATPase [Haloferax]|uniref:AAA domain-containing protein n=1 Tax=Haloferax marinum TaxID=2666143 RepID=A0A6A8G7Q6_9EURY|nr:MULTISPECIES: MoxR family ATPase [Haloferax]KAB1198230.1 MoxR family ATPase [Haloferax sp. CBA1150]MRW97320.1 AAA domain-containing protein [Haloferax marinum]
MAAPQELYTAIRDEASSVLIGNEDVIERLTISLLTDGHVLLEGVPGVAKTTIANIFARALGLEFQRIQMTPDLLPADVTGTNVYRENIGEFQLQRGPIFGNVIVADEINRATPKTQSALLEAMQERQVTIEGETLELPEPFIVIATQNPIEMDGTFGLPEAQRDRFQFKLSVDIPSREDEAAVLDRFTSQPNLTSSSIEPVATSEDIQTAREAVSKVHIAPVVQSYLLDIVEATRENEYLEHGASPRAGITTLRAAQARAAIDGRDYVIPDDIKELAADALSHRLVLSTNAELSNVLPREIIEEILETVPAPSADDVLETVEV